MASASGGALSSSGSAGRPVYTDDDAGCVGGDALGRVWNHFAAFNDVSSYALIGSAGLLAAATLGPLSSAVFLLELTRKADSLMVPLLTTTTGATITARRCEVRSIYSARVEAEHG